MTNIGKCPCEQCILLAICRHKEYTMLFIECSIIANHVADKNRQDDEDIRIKLVEQLETTLNPTKWKYDYYPAENSKHKLIMSK
jgi:hypothetical protein